MLIVSFPRATIVLSLLCNAYSLIPRTRIGPCCGISPKVYSPQSSTKYHRRRREHEHPAVPQVLSYCQSILNVSPLATKAAISSIAYGAGDVIAQKVSSRDSVLKPETSSINYPRLGRYMVTGLLSGLFWVKWYELCDIICLDLMSSILGSVHASEAAMRTVLSLALEQLAWCPLFYGLFLIPFSALLNGATPEKIPGEVQNKLGGLLIDNAKVWTFANILIYNAPPDVRSIVANAFDLVWAYIVAKTAANCGVDDEECIISTSELAQSSRSAVAVPFTSSGQDSPVEVEN